MGTLFEGIDEKDGSFAAIHCNKTICYRLAKAANGGYQAIEELAANRLRTFAESWDIATTPADRNQAASSLFDECFGKCEDEMTVPEDIAIDDAVNEIIPRLCDGNGAEALIRFLNLSRNRLGWKLFRNELWRDTERAAGEMMAGRAETMSLAAANVRQRVSVSGRKLPRRTVSTPLLLKGLEFEHVVIPDATHFLRENNAQAKLFYVAISRATTSLAISSPERFIRLPIPN